MTIKNIHTNLSKTINCEAFNPFDLNILYSFYTNHKDYIVIIDNEIN